ncbi:MAG: Gldg family protein [Verrucomicrobia bacterium]|nr:Gldg family protein [Verrucomicrobiota bacterium]
MKGKFDSLLYSVIGVIAVLIIVMAINVFAGFFKFRTDLTENKLYTLSNGTKKILNKLDTDVAVRFYFSKDNASVPVPLRTYAQEVQDLLAEYQQYSHGKVKVIKLDPKPDSDAEDSANLDGIEGQAVDLTDKIYLGIAVSCLDAKTTIPYLSPERETLLEYDLSRAISSVANPKKAVIGVMSALPVTGREANPMMMQQRQQSSPPWIFLTELKENYVVRDVPLTTDKIDDDISVLVVVHPQGIAEDAQFAIDQFLLRGGKMVALLDPYSFVEAQTAGPYGGAPSYNSTLSKLLPAWGIDFSVKTMIADPTFATQVQRQSDVQSDPTILSITSEGINKGDALSAAVNDLLMPFAGAFTGKPADDLKEDILIKSSKQAGLVDVSLIEAGPDAIRKQLKSANMAYPIAIRLTGKFKTAFPDGKPAGKSSAKPSPSPTPSATPSTSPGSREGYLKEAKSEGVVILVGDSDFAYDSIAGRAQQVMTQTVFVPSNGNLNFIQSCVEQLAGDSDLIGIRSRASGNRPFVVVNKMEAAAQQKYQSKIDELEDNLNQTRQNLAALQTSKQSDQKTLLSPEQQAEIKKFQENEATTNKELKVLRKNLRQEIDSLQTTVKWVDIAGMPVIVTLIGLTLAVVKRRSRAAR